MPKYASYDPTVASPSPVTGWYDTDKFTYNNLPPISNLFTVDDTTWNNRDFNKLWFVTPTGLTSQDRPTPTPVPPTLSQQATAMLSDTTGVLATFTTTTELTATYKTDLESQVNILSEASYLFNPANTAGLFIGGVSTFDLYDVSGTKRTMTPAMFIAFEPVYSAWVKTVKVVRDSGVGPLPPATITINA